MINKKGLTLSQALAALVILSIAIATATSILYSQVKSIKAVNDDILYSFYLNDINTYADEMMSDITTLDKYDLHEEGPKAIHVVEVENQTAKADFFTDQIKKINGSKKEVKKITNALVESYYLEATSEQKVLNNFTFVYFEYTNIDTLETYIKSLGLLAKTEKDILSDINTFKTAIANDVDLDTTNKRYLCIFTTDNDKGYALIKEGPSYE